AGSLAKRRRHPGRLARGVADRISGRRIVEPRRERSLMMTAFSTLLDDLKQGKLSRRALLQRAALLGLTPAMTSALLRESAFAQDATPAASPTASGPGGPAVDTVTYGAFNVDQAPLNIQNGDIDLYVFGLKTAGAKSLEGVA